MTTKTQMADTVTAGQLSCSEFIYAHACMVSRYADIAKLAARRGNIVTVGTIYPDGYQQTYWPHREGFIPGMGA